MPSNSLTDSTSNTPSKGTLYVVATPIGNMDDITLRALNVLDQVDLIAAEDTRHTGKLLKYHNIKSRLMSYHEHNEKERTPLLIERIESGSSIALVSSAGTPTVSDPGYTLLQSAVEKGIRIIPIPGVSASVTALSISGLPTDSFIFIGFCAKKKAKRLKQLQELADEKKTLIFYENPGRILTFMEEIARRLRVDDWRACKNFPIRIPVLSAVNRTPSVSACGLKPTVASFKRGFVPGPSTTGSRM